MNIDREKFLKFIGDEHDAYYSENINNHLTESEIKADCDKCTSLTKTEYNCEGCMFDKKLENCFQAETDTSKIFIGAPIMAVIGGYESLVNYHPGNFIGYTSLRLPTLKEAPRNVWLAPWDKFPEGFNELNHVLLKMSDTWIIDSKNSMDSGNVKDIKAIMIVGDLEYE